MKNIFRTSAMFMAAAAMTLGMASCNKDDDDDAIYNEDDSAALAIIEQFVDNTVAPTYTALAAHAEQLADELAVLKEGATNAGVDQACSTFLAAREQWEKSEAFLFGAAGDFGIDPHIDSWPLDEDAFNRLMSSPDMLAALNGEDGDVVAGERLGNALLGFHGIEYILFANGQPKAADAISENEWIYVVAVAGDLRNRCYQLEVGWLGDDAPEAHIEKLDDLEMQYTVASGDYSYGENMENAGQAGSTYRTRKAALMAIVQGCIDIADEVGSSKIGAAYTGEDVTYIESPYSQTSIVDFHNNIVSIRNAYMGGVENARDESKSIHNHVKNINAALDTEVQEAIEAALAAIDAMPAPFVNHISDARNGAAMEACAALSEKLDEVVDALRNN
ncbi:MAG: iron-regulated protein A [bacterium P3]|nr:MAG: iron-regulated protein A [bacterium P3]KWW40068.1 MAG: iron-regulated protein A [bacterium F083]